MSAADPTGVVVSQLYGGGGNAGSTYRNDFVELASLLEHAQQLIEELRQGLGLVPDSLPDVL